MDASSIFVETSGDANATIQVYSQVDGNIAFCLVGYWSTPPGTYNEAADALGSASSDQTWQDADLSGFGVPANAIVQIVMANAFATSKNRQGLREKGCTTASRPAIKLFVFLTLELSDCRIFCVGCHHT